jgi:hypothetical protein
MYPGLMILAILVLVILTGVFFTVWDGRQTNKSIKKKEVRALQQQHKAALKALTEIAAMAHDSLVVPGQERMALDLIQMRANSTVIENTKEIT